ncbi:glutamine-hydrolyzing carbamoyl-phosphate synthase small subunit [Anaerotalea alkaliphila]|uniref:Carbamoyl phosphate synthase small chain n=1 Tax=Anaerotalea alkaliphila TaxID=2662126 RepID=A0A7X5KMG0_9FIRM|nr:glutamine-hydrolyzing carbamoyl-phosphate synthase small subunit [Anaerotalea alkaliphila]NDL66914.1 glutamine-hydrolyzing carbamoyl-phosphate synthase small subunit [Anaerotalea alkaliphila]
MKATMLLEDGTRLEGQAFGAEGTVLGEVVFNTGMTGYQEILTDPSYAGQVVTMTYPLVGNYGINGKDMESDRVQVSGFVVKELARVPSHWECTETLDQYLKRNNILGMDGVDTRMLTKRIRNKGTMNCILTTEPLEERHRKMLEAYSFPKDIVARVSARETRTYGPPDAPWAVGLVDLGLKRGILEQLLAHSCRVVVFPHDVQAREIEEAALDALLFSNGPGDPKDARNAIALAGAFLGKMPVWGICLGHQIIALALGADTYKLKFGHRGSNHPVIDMETGNVFISSQNHGYAVDGASVEALAATGGPLEGLRVTHWNVNDETVEGLSCPALGMRCVQFHPEEGPGPHDAHHIFSHWVGSLGRR